MGTPHDQPSWDNAQLNAPSLGAVRVALARKPFGDGRNKLVYEFGPGPLEDYVLYGPPPTDLRGRKSKALQYLMHTSILHSHGYEMQHYSLRANYGQPLVVFDMEGKRYKIARKVHGQNLFNYLQLKVNEPAPLSNEVYQERARILAELPQEVYDDLADQVKHAREEGHGGDSNLKNIMFDGKRFNLIDVIDDIKPERQCFELYDRNLLLADGPDITIMREKLKLAFESRGLPMHLIEPILGNDLANYASVATRGVFRKVAHVAIGKSLPLHATVGELRDLLKQAERENGLKF